MDGTNAILRGSIQFQFDALTNNLQLIRSGKLKALAVTGTRRERALPDVPTVAELGLPGLTTDIFFGLVAPPGTSSALAARIADGVKLALADLALSESLVKSGNEPAGSTPQQFRALINRESARFRALLKAKGVQPE